MDISEIDDDAQALAQKMLAAAPVADVVVARALWWALVFFMARVEKQNRDLFGKHLRESAPLMIDIADELSGDPIGFKKGNA